MNKPTRLNRIVQAGFFFGFFNVFAQKGLTSACQVDTINHVERDDCSPIVYELWRCTQVV